MTNEKYPINSGSVYSCQTLKEVGPFDEQLKIDGIDFDYGKRIHLKKIPICRINEAILKQTFGSTTHKKMGGQEIQATCYSAQRIYSVTKSNMYLLRKYGFDSYLCLNFLKHWTLTYFIKMLLLENDRWDKIKSYFRGWRDGRQIPLPPK